MSELTTIETTLLTTAQTAVAGLQTTWGDVAWDKLPGSALPHAFVQPFSKQPVLGDLGSEDRVIEGSLFIISALSIEDARAKADLVEAAIVADRSLGGIVSTTGVSLDSGTDPTTKRHWARLTVTCTQRDGSLAVAGGPLVKWELAVRVTVKGATVPATYLSSIAAALVTTLTATRMSSDLDDPAQEAVPANSTRFQLSSLTSLVLRGSNLTVKQIAMRLRVYHRGSAGQAERVYTEGALITATQAVLLPSYWVLGLTDVEIAPDDEPEISFPSDVARL